MIRIVRISGWDGGTGAGLAAVAARRAATGDAHIRAHAEEACYCTDNGRLAIDPVLLLGISLLQYLEAMPDRQAVDLLHYHAGWNFALNRQVGDELFHSTTLVIFRQRLLDHGLSTIGFAMVLEALVAAGWWPGKAASVWTPPGCSGGSAG